MGGKLCKDWEPVPLSRQHMDRNILAVAHAHEAGGDAPQRPQVGGARGAQSEEMCLLEEVPPSTSDGPSSTTTAVRSRLLHHQLLAPHLPGQPRPSPPPGAPPPPPPPPPPTPSPALAPAKIRGLSTKNSSSRKHEQSQPPSCFSITVPRLQREAKKKATFSRKGWLLEQNLLKTE